MGCYLARDPTDLPTDLNRYLIQEVIEAPEFSVDAYICHDGSISIRVPRSRDKIVGGEAYRSTVGAPAEVLDVSDKLLTKMSEVGFRGAVNVQLFATPRPLVIEVNARLGSASVLSNRAVEGGLYKALLNNFLGKSTPRNRDHFIHGLQLYRFLGDMFFDGGTSPPLLYPTNSHPKDDGYDPH